jgi:hypothetical protein
MAAVLLGVKSPSAMLAVLLVLVIFCVMALHAKLSGRPF